MKRRFLESRPLTIVAAALVALVIASAGALAASGTGSGGTVYSCVKSRGGTVRIVTARSKCKRSEHRLSWGTGGGTAYEVVRADGPSGVLHGSETFPPSPLTTVATLSGIPAGTYDIRAITNINVTGPGHSVACELNAGGEANLGEGQVGGSWDAGVNINTQLLHTFNGAGSATLSCASEGNTLGETWIARNTSIIALPVGGGQVTRLAG